MGIFVLSHSPSLVLECKEWTCKNCYPKAEMNLTNSKAKKQLNGECLCNVIHGITKLRYHDEEALEPFLFFLGLDSVRAFKVRSIPCTLQYTCNYVSHVSYHVEVKNKGGNEGATREYQRGRRKKHKEKKNPS